MTWPYGTALLGSFGCGLKKKFKEVPVYLKLEDIFNYSSKAVVSNIFNARQRTKSHSVDGI